VGVFFSVQEFIPVANGRQLQICAGAQSRSITTALPGVFAISKGLYTGHVLEIKITPQ